jgi:hypothetical protein
MKKQWQLFFFNERNEYLKKFEMTNVFKAAFHRHKNFIYKVNYLVVSVIFFSFIKGLTCSVVPVI